MTSSRKVKANDRATLDLFSTSPTTALQERVSSSSPCIYNAPFFAYQTAQMGWHITQGNCHHWDCPRCGPKRASYEYHRVVQGAELLSQAHSLYFLTLTCRGRELSREDAIANYGHWTHKLLSALSMDARRTGKAWHYVQVTEWQKRGHPHSHIITSYCPDDAIPGKKTSRKTRDDGTQYDVERDCLLSDYLRQRCISAGLGAQYDLSLVVSAAAVGRYVAKYLFKPTMFSSSYPKHWRRIRYSSEYPDPPKAQSECIRLISADAWRLLAQSAVFVQTDGATATRLAKRWLRGADTFVQSV